MGQSKVVKGPLGGAGTGRTGTPANPAAEHALYGLLSRWPDPDHASLQPWDASDILLLDVARECLNGEELLFAVDGCRYGALALSLAYEFPRAHVRVYQDSLGARRALENNLSRVRGAGHRLGNVEIVADRMQAMTGADAIFAQLPKANAAVGEIGRIAALCAKPMATLFAAARIKYLNQGMSSQLRRYFAEVSASLAYRKSRALIASQPRAADAALKNPKPAGPAAPASGFTSKTCSLEVAGRELELLLCADPETFGGSTLDPGTRLLLRSLPPEPFESTMSAENQKPTDSGAPGEHDDEAPADRHIRVHDLGSGNGTISAAVAARFPDVQLTASDISAAAVRSTLATLRANGATGVHTNHAIGLEHVPDGSLDIVLLNPPFHQGGRVDTNLAGALFADAHRALRPGGQLFTVWNSHLRYMPLLEHTVGPTTRVAKDPRFTVTVSYKA